VISFRDRFSETVNGVKFNIILKQKFLRLKALLRTFDKLIHFAVILKQNFTVILKINFKTKFYIIYSNF
jgi:hypothetical protein